MYFVLIRIFLILNFMLSSMGESLHAISIFDFHHVDGCEIVSEHFDSIEKSNDNDCPICQMHSSWDVISDHNSVAVCFHFPVLTLITSESVSKISRINTHSVRGPPSV